MRDLYKPLQLGRNASEDLIRYALGDPIKGRHQLAEHARSVLLRPQRRQQYDRVHAALRHIAQLRLQTGTSGTPFAQAYEADFVASAEAEAISAMRATAQRQQAAKTTTGSHAKNQQKAKASLGGSAWTWIILVGIGLSIWGAYSNTKTSGSSRTRPSAEATRSLPPAMALPQTGAFDSSVSTTQNAIIVKTRSGGRHTLAKIETLDGREVTRGFIRAGGQHRFDLPLGTYVMKTASGTTWYGSTVLFGPETSYSRPDDTFPLTSRGESWTVELIPQANGNLRDRPISAAQF